MRPGLGSVPDMQLIYGDLGNPQATPSAADNPKIQQLAALPSGTSAPNTVITPHAIQRYKLQTSLDGWFIQAPQQLTSAQISSARQIAANAGVTVETKSGELGLNQISDGATVLGLVIALGVLVMSAYLVRSETSGDLRTLAATGASSRIRRSITSATAYAIGLLGAILGAAGATAAACRLGPQQPDRHLRRLPGAGPARRPGRPAAGGGRRRLAAGRRYSRRS